MKTCKGCDEVKPLADFKKGHFYVNECRTCRIQDATGGPEHGDKHSGKDGISELPVADLIAGTFGDALFRRLRKAKRPDLVALLQEDLKKDQLEVRGLTDKDLVLEISEELRAAAGTSIANRFRGPHEFSYKQLLIDVADKLAPGIIWTSFKVSGPETEEQIEGYIYKRVLILIEKHLESLNNADKAKLQERLEADLRARGLPEQVVTGAVSALAAGTLTGLMAGPLIATALFGSLWTWLFGLSLGQLILGGFAVGGPVGLVAAALMAASGPSYSKTIPAVTRLILIRLSHDAESNLGRSH
jgi:uncharacterized protein YaaW (UPF0174 family)